MTYTAFFRQEWRFLSFGLLLTFASGFGQTYFVGLFSGELRSAFALSHGDYGLIYSGATLGSAITIMLVGGLIDRWPLARFTSFTIVALAISAFGLSQVQHWMFLPLAIYGLRLSGQGLLSHISSTSMGRFYDAHRGKALSISSFGHPISEAIFPLAAVALMAATNWRTTWMIISGFVVVVIWPLAMVASRARPHPAHHPIEASHQQTADRSKTRKDVLREPAFYLMLPALLAMPFIVTGIFFHQVHVAEVKGYGPTVFASAFVTYAIATVAAAALAGLLIDRFGARRLLPAFLAPMASGLFLLAALDQPVVIHGFMILSGLSTGLYATISGAIWPELYGTRFLGSIRSMVMSLMVFSTSASPFLFGFLIDVGVSLVTILLGACIYVVIASLATIGVARQALPEHKGSS